MKDIEIVALMAATIYASPAIYASRSIIRDEDVMREAIKKAEQLYSMVIERESSADPSAWT